MFKDIFLILFKIDMFKKTFLWSKKKIYACNKLFKKKFYVNYILIHTYLL